MNTSVEQLYNQKKEHSIHGKQRTSHRVVEKIRTRRLERQRRRRVGFLRD